MKKDFIKYTILLSLGTILSRVFVIVYRLLCAQAFTLEDYGRLALVVSLFTNISILAHIDIAAAMSKYASEFRISKKKQLPVLFYTGLVAILPTSIFATLVFIATLNYYGLLNLEIGLLSFVSILFFSVYHHTNGFARGFEKIRESAFFSSLKGLSRLLIFIIIFYALGVQGLTAGLYAFFLSNIAPGILNLKYSLSLIRKSALRVSKTLLRKIYAFTGFLVIAEFAYVGIALLPRLILSFDNMADVALFDMALLLYSVFLMALSNIPAALIPLVSKNRAQKKKFNINLIEFGIISLIFMTIAYTSFYFGVDTYAITKILGEKYAPSLNIFHIVFIALPFHAYYAIISGILQGLGRVKDLLRINLVGIIFSVIAYSLGIQYGLTGLGVGYVATLITLSLIAHISFKKIRVQAA